MKTEISDKEAIGKTVEKFVYSLSANQMIVCFDDDTFTTFGIDPGYESGDEEIVNVPLEWFDFGHEKLVRTGILSEKEWESMWNKERQIEQERLEISERNQYLRLKSKYEKK